jgi:hypothetical protein
MKATIKEQRAARALTVEVWEWLAENPSKDKKDWPRYQEIKSLSHTCPLCDLYKYGYQGARTTCLNCPLGKVGKICNISDCNPFEIWDHGNIIERHEAALEIALVTACWSIDGDGGI